MSTYRIHISLQDFEGAKSGRRYTCTRETLYTDVPEGEFKELGRDEYSKISSTEISSTDLTLDEGALPGTQEAPHDDDLTDDSSSSNDP